MNAAPNSSARSARVGNVVLLAAALAAVVWGTVVAIDRFWVCDDAFISFRYAQNLVAGNGLVFNAGEYVEGYTNFLWTMLVAGAMAAGIDPVAFGQWGGLACYVATMLCCVWAGRRCRSPVVAIAPLAVVGVGLHEHLAVYASCGLETSLFTLLLTAMLVLLIEARRSRTFLLAGVCGALLAMTRPDGALPYAVAGACLAAVVRPAAGWRSLLAFAAPALLLWAPWFAWRWSYYGWPFPNTFYAKSGGDGRLGQGLVYVALYFVCYWLLLAAPLVAAARLRVHARRHAAIDPGWNGGRAPLLLLTVPLTYLAFVAWVGGDFMFARFCLPVTPALFLALQLVAPVLQRPAAVVVATAIVGAATLLRVPTVDSSFAAERGIVEEPRAYPPEYVDYMRRAGLVLKERMQGLDARVVIGGGQAMLAYYGEFPLVIEGAAGLTDEHLAHLPLPARGRIGHEKNVGLDPGYLFRRGVDFWFVTADPPPGDRIGALRRVDFFGLFWGILVTYDRQVLEPLRARGLQFPDFERHLDEYLAGIDTRPLDEVRADYASFRDYYFAHNDDPERERAFRRRLGE